MLLLIYIATFLFTLENALLLYVNSSFLAQHLQLGGVNLVYIIANALNIIILMALPSLLRRFGHRRVLTPFLVITILSLFGLTLDNALMLTLSLFVIQESIFIVVRTIFDLYVEEYSSNATTGKTRGLFLTIINAAVLFAPLIVGTLVTDGNYESVYLAAGGITLLVLIFSLIFLQRIPDISYQRMPLFSSIKLLINNPDMRNVYMTNLLLQFYFAWMTIYVPIYLHLSIGFAWKEIGVIFFVMLLPYILLQIPLGYLADKRTGEKEFLVLGFVIMIISTAVLSFIHTQNMLLWATILFITRLGTATVEVMSETYFFKKIVATDTGELSLFRDTKPLAYIIAPLLGVIILPLISSSYLFLTLSILILPGLYFSSRLRDTR